MVTTTRQVPRVQATLVALIASTTLVATAGPASATHQPICGETITHSITLSASLVNCPDDGLIVGASSIVIDLNGHTISGLPGVPQVGGTGAGVLIDGYTGVTVKNGTIEHFDGGVVIVKGSGHTVSDLAINDNVGSPVSAWGEGVGVWESDGNTIQDNTVARNGPYAGIGLYFHIVDGTPSGSSGNTIRDNTVTDNDIAMSTTNQDIGIRVEHDSTGNTIDNNTVTGSGLDGIAIFATAFDNDVTNNTVKDNGNHLFTHRKGDGIRLWEAPRSAPAGSPGADRTLLSGNTVCGSGANGIYVGSKDNNTANGAGIFDNTAGTGTGCAGNHAGVASPTAAATYEFHDITALSTNGLGTACGNNEWKRNTTHAAGSSPEHAYNNACTVTS